MKRSLYFMLSLLIAGSTLLSCGGDVAGDSSMADSVAENSVTSDTETPPTLMDALPEADYDGYVFHVFLNSGENHEADVLTAGEENGEVLNDVVHRRNRAVEEKYNVVIAPTTESGDISGGDMMKREVQAGLDDHDLFFLSSHSANLAANGYTYCLSDLPQLDLSASWWDQACIEGLSIGGNVYMLTGDISPSSLLMSSCIAFNKNLLSANDIEYPYVMAEEGRWTLDALAAMTKGLTQDLNGDGQYTMESDLFGMTAWTADVCFSLFFGAGCRFAIKDENDIPYVNFDMDRISAVYDKMYGLLIEENAHYVTESTLHEATYECFEIGHAYFCEISFNKIDLFLRNMEDDYGLIPIPKFDEQQEHYISCVNASGCLVMMPSSAKDPDRTGTIMEALAVGAHETVTPSLYEIIVKNRNARDEESAKMVDLIIENRVFDPIYINLIDGWAVVHEQLSAKRDFIVSALEKKAKGMTRGLNKITDAYEKQNQ